MPPQSCFSLAELVTRDLLAGRAASSAPAIFLIANGFDAAALRKAAEIYRGTDPVLADVLTEEAEARLSDGAVALLGMVMGIPPRPPAHKPAPDAAAVVGVSVIEGSYSVGLAPGGGRVDLTLGNLTARLVPAAVWELISDLTKMAAKADGRTQPVIVVEASPEPLVPAAYAGAFSTYSDQVLAEIGDALTRRPSPAVIFDEWIAGATPGAAAVKLLGQGSLKARR